MSAELVTPAAILALTLAAYAAGISIHRLSGGNVLLNPLLLAVAIVVGVLAAFKLPYASYYAATAPIHFFIGPAVVALAVPLYRQIERIRRNPGAVLLGIALGSCAAVSTALSLISAMGASWLATASMAPKSVTTPVAMAIAAEIGGVPAVTAAIVVLTGIVGYAFGPAVLNWLGIHDPLARGLAYGTAAHIMGTAKAAQESEEAAAVAGLAMAANAMATAIVLPLAWPLIGPKP